MDVIISGGGTGGHIYPALAIAEQLKLIKPEIRITFVGTKDGLENKILQNYDYELLYIDVRGFERSLSADTYTSLKKAFSGLKQSRKIIKKIKPAIVIGTGGYVCGTIVLAAFLAGIKTCIQEQNAVPGVTNRLLGKIASRVFLGNEAAVKYFPNKNKIFIDGNPIRSDIMQADRKEAQQILELDPAKITILVSGGSRGAKSINDAMLCVNKKFADSSEVQIIHITGSDGYESFVNELPEPVKQAKNIKVISYMKNMPLALAASDLAIFRAGALGLSELSARGIPSILIPYPYATANHQEHNARYFEKQNAAIVVRDNELTGESLYGLINILLNDKERLQAMADAAKNIGRPDAAEKIVENILSLI